MPTISQLPAATQVTAADQVPVSQSGVTRSVSLGTLLAGTQPAILASPGVLLGRTSIGAGGPEPIIPGTGLTLNASTLCATGLDHAGFVVQGSLQPADQLVLNSDGQPKLMEVSLLRGLFTAGSDITINSSGTIATIASGGSAGPIAVLPAGSPPSAEDLISISQGGTDCAITYATLLDGVTIDMAQPAAPAQDGDQFWVSQSGSTMVRQTLGALWAWVVSKLPGAMQPVVELTSDTTLDTIVHNGRLLICSQPVSLTLAVRNLGNGFACEVINLSSGAVSLGSGVLASSGVGNIPPGQMAAVRCATYSGGTIVYASLSDPGAASAAPAAVTGLAAGPSTAYSVALAWNAVPGAASYLVQYRVLGDTNWTLATSGLTATAYVVTGLQASVTYEFAALAVNPAGSSSSLSTVTATTAPLPAAPGQATGLVATAVSTNSIDISWASPSSCGLPMAYTVQYRVASTIPWTGSAAGISATQFTATGLLSGTTYEIEVIASNLAGAGPASAILSVSTSQAGSSVTAVTWNMVPAASYTHGTGAVAVNVHVTPGNAAVQFGLSASASSPPTAWTAADYVNTDLWGVYLATPPSPGAYYVWVSGTDGSCPAVCPSAFMVT